MRGRREVLTRVLGGGLFAGSLLGGGVFGVTGCSGAPAASTPAPVPTAAPRPPPTVIPSAAASAEPTATASVEPPPPPPPPPVPPPKGTPPHERTAAPNDGVWEPYVAAGAGEPALMYKTVLHPHPVKKDIDTVVVAIDLTRTDVVLVAGTEEPKTKVVPESRRTGLVPADVQDDLLAIMNGGFMTQHGKYGMMLDGDDFFEPREDACAVAKRKDGTMWIAPFADVKGKNAELSYYRQTPACLIEKGALHADLDNEYKMRKWGGQNNGRKDTRRSALGLDASGKVLFYGIGEWVFPKDLAVAMKAAGAVAAAETDINWSYTRFLLMGRPTPADPVQVVSTLVPKMVHSKRGYVEKAATRDFFYVARKKAAPAATK